MYKNVDSTGALIARILRGRETVGYLFNDYMTNNKYLITKESAIRMAGGGSLEVLIGTAEETVYVDGAGRLRVEGKLRMSDLPDIKESDFIKKTSKNTNVTVEQLLKSLKSNYNTWYEIICARGNRYINITDTTCNLDTWFAGVICKTLGMHSADFKKYYEEYGVYDREGKYIINLADKGVYTDLVRIVKEFSKDYQLKTFLKDFVSAINKK